MAQAPKLPPSYDWFLRTQMGLLTLGGDIPAWFHGAISRTDAEDLLASEPLGSFLLRVSHSHVGYTLSYRSQSCCRHFMVKHLDTGGFLIPGHSTVHPSLASLVAFHQQQPLRPHQELLTQACGQKDPANVDYEDLLLYSRAPTREAAGAPPAPSTRQLPSSCPSALPPEGTPRLVPGPWLAGMKQKAETMARAGKKVQQQLKRHLLLGAVNLPAQSQNVYTDLHVDPASRDAESRKSPSMESATGSPLTSRGCILEPEDWAAPHQSAEIPEEYLRPPPFAPGFS